METRRSERGQVLVLIILAFVGIMGFAALAVDAGQLYSERRRAQSAADSAAMAAAYAALNKADPYATGYQMADTNGFNNDGATNTVTINNPPASGPYAGDAEYFQVIIQRNVDPIFAQFIFGGQQGVTTEAVARSKPIQSVSASNAIHSLSPDEDSMTWDGDIKIKVNGGNIFSNGGITKTGSAGNVSVTNGNVYASGSYNGTGHAAVSPAPIYGVAQQDITGLIEPYCPKKNETWNGVNYYYHNGLNGSAVLQPGFHCFYNNIVLNGSDVLSGNGVVLVMMQGGLKMTGNSKLNLKRPNDIVDKNGNHYGGLLIYAPPSNHSEFDLGGTAQSLFTGTILAPGGTCDIGGTPDSTNLHAAVICWKVVIHGTSSLNVIYREEENIRVSPQVELSQ